MKVSSTVLAFSTILVNQVQDTLKSKVCVPYYGNTNILKFSRKNLCKFPFSILSSKFLKKKGISHKEMDLLERSKFCRINNLIEQSQNKNLN